MVLFRITENEPSKMHVRPYVYSRPWCTYMSLYGRIVFDIFKPSKYIPFSNERLTILAKGLEMLKVEDARWYAMRSSCFIDSYVIYNINYFLFICF